MLIDEIQAILTEALSAARESGKLPAVELPEPAVEHPKQAQHGDFSTNVALVTASTVRKETGDKSNPREIAQAIADLIPIDGLIEEVSLAGPGFINLRLSPAYLQQQIPKIVDAGPDFGAIDRGQGARWQVEFVSSNPTGPLHYGGARNAVLGDTFSNVLDAAGYDVSREFYVNDMGRQIDLFVQTLFARYLQVHGQEAEVPEGGYQGDYMLDYARKLSEKEGARFLEMEPAQASQELRDIGLQLVLDDLADELKLIGVEFDCWFSEASLHEDGLVDELLERLSEKDLIVDRDGARWFRASRYPRNEKDEVVVKSDGAPTYFASDIAYHYNKFVQRGFDRVVNVWAVDHQGHVPRMAAIMQALDLDPDRLIILLYNLVKLIRDGREVKMSKRSGDFLTLREVVEEVGPDAVRFMLLTRSPEAPIEFDLDLAIEQSDENPVYYVQYSHARISSILAKATAEGFDASQRNFDDVDLTLLVDPAELNLVRKMLELEEQIDFAVEKLSPHNLTHYARDLASVFNRFYRDCRVVDEQNPELTRARLALCIAAQVALRRVLTLLGLQTPETM